MNTRVVPEDLWGLIKASGEVEVRDRLPSPAELGALFSLWTINGHRIATVFDSGGLDVDALQVCLKNDFDSAVLVNIVPLSRVEASVLFSINVPTQVLAIASALTAIDSGDVGADEPLSVHFGEEEVFRVVCVPETEVEAWVVTVSEP